MTIQSIRAAQVEPCTEAEGPGRRFAVWFQGCPLRCAGCCNPEMLRFEGGVEIKIVDLLDEIDTAVECDRVEGITLLGGEPFAHAYAAVLVAEMVRQRGLTVWRQPNTLEIRLDASGLSVNGFPSATTKQFWHRPALSEQEKGRSLRSKSSVSEVT